MCHLVRQGYNCGHPGKTTRQRCAHYSEQNMTCARGRSTREDVYVQERCNFCLGYELQQAARRKPAVSRDQHIKYDKSAETCCTVM